MPYQHHLQASRFELKYILDEHTATGVRGFSAAHLIPDEHASISPDNAYPVHSLYIDSPDMTLYRQTACGLKNRFKLRVRFYDDNPASPAFMEIKRRVTNVIRKERAAVTRDGVRKLLEGGSPDGRYLFGDKNDKKSGSALENFVTLYHSIDGLGQIYVNYVREAYVSPESDQIRVTFDRQLVGSSFERENCLAPPATGVAPNVGGVILELKFTDRFPPWMAELVQAFDLQRCSVPKYNLCVEAMGLQPWNDQRARL